MAQNQTLELRVGYDAKEAEDGLKSLAASLKSIKSALSGDLDLRGVSSSLQSFRDSLNKAVPEDTLKKLNRLTEALESVKKAAGGNAGKSLAKTRESLESALPTVEKDAGLTSAASTVEKANESTENMANNMQSAMQAAHEVDAGMKSANQAIQQCVISTKEATTGIRKMFPSTEVNQTRDRYGMMGRRFGENPNAIPAHIAIEAKKAGDAFDGVTGKTRETTRSLQLATEQATALGNAFLQANNPASLLAMKVNDATARLGQGIASGNMSGTQIANAASQIQHMREELEKLNPSGLVGVRQALENVGKGAKAAFGWFGKLIQQFSRMLKYRIIRTVIKEIGEAFTVGLENVRKYSEAINGLYARDMTALDNSLLKMKNSIGASLAVAFQQLIPYIQQVISFVITAVNYLNQFFALLSGAKTWTRAVDTIANIEENTKKVGSAARGAAKDVKGLLASWDELNIIQSQSGSGGGGGVGAAAESMEQYEKMFTEDSNFAPQIQWLVDHLDTIKQLAIGIGAAWLTWKIASPFVKDIGSLLRIAAGIGAVVWGVQMQWEAFSDQLNNGIDWQNLTQNVSGALLVVGGLGMIFGKTGFAIGMIGEGIALAIAPIKELIETGKLADESLTQLSIAVLLVGGGLSILTGSWIPIAIAAVATAVAWVVQKWDDIKTAISTWYENSALKTNIVDPTVTLFSNMAASISGFFSDPVTNIQTAWNGLVTWFRTNVVVPITNFGIDIENAIIEAINFVIAKFYEVKVWVTNNIINPIRKLFVDLINLAIGGINSVIDGLNSALNWEIEIPEFLRGFLEERGVNLVDGKMSLGVGTIGKIPELDAEINDVSLDDFDIPQIETIAHITAIEVDDGLEDNQPEPVIPSPTYDSEDSFYVDVETVFPGIDDTQYDESLNSLKSNTEDVVSDIENTLSGVGTALDNVGAKITESNWDSLFMSDPHNQVWSDVFGAGFDSDWITANWSSEVADMFRNGIMQALQTQDLYMYRQPATGQGVTTGNVPVTGEVTVGNMASDVATGTAQGNQEQNGLLREQNRLLRQLLNKDFGGSAKPSSTAGRIANESISQWLSIAGLR